jgi:hypothetical protein
MPVGTNGTTREYATPVFCSKSERNTNLSAQHLSLPEPKDEASMNWRALGVTPSYVQLASCHPPQRRPRRMHHPAGVLLSGSCALTARQ